MDCIFKRKVVGFQRFAASQILNQMNDGKELLQLTFKLAARSPFVSWLNDTPVSSTRLPFAVWRATNIWLRTLPRRALSISRTKHAPCRELPSLRVGST